ncbi:heat shock 70 kDa protein 14-like [Amphiura filiformis]|uniref:heat shock 70 kDa protein 14-like n=1 Tax=Amphiura filiformis TaxID=82378 RepID=UPI003B214D94
MAASLGLYFGGTSACLALHKDGKTSVIANDAGDRVTPAMVAFTEKEQLVGLSAKQGRARNAVNTVTHVKQIIGRRYDDPVVSFVNQNHPFKIVDKSGEPMYQLEMADKHYLKSPLEVATLIFKKLKETAEDQGGYDEEDVVLVAPVDYSSEQLNLLRTSAEKAGFNVLRIIGEPSAALLAHGVGQEYPSEQWNVLVYKLGGSSLSVSILNVNNGIFRILATETDRTCGGDQLTSLLVESCAKDFKRQWKVDVNESKRALAKLYNTCENCKHVLSTLPTASGSIDSLHEGIDFSTSISRAKLDSLANSHYQKAVQPIRTVLEKAKMTSADIHKVVLVGGSTRIPKLQQYLKSCLPEAEVLNSVAPDEVLAIGAAIEAAILTGKDDEEIELKEDDLHLECCSKNILVKVIGTDGEAELKTAIPKLTYFPVKKQHDFKVNKGQTSVCLHVYEGDNGAIDTATLLAKLTLADLPTDTEEELNISTVFHFKREGTLHVSCSEATSGKIESLTIGHEDLEESDEDDDKPDEPAS